MNPSDSPIWILGAGYFGKKAVDIARKRFPDCAITVVDRDPASLEDFAGSNLYPVCMDAVRFLDGNLNSGDHPQWIIPVVPLHLAFEWIRLRLQGEFSIGPIRVPEAVLDALPNPMPGNEGEVYTSIADFRCPENCPEPEGRCTHTGLPRPFILHEFLKTLRFPGFQTVILRSLQLGPGVGGYPPTALFTALDAIKSSPDGILLGTACQCHGVIQAFRLS
jgi:hypothetical protein